MIRRNQRPFHGLHDVFRRLRTAALLFLIVHFVGTIGYYILGNEETTVMDAFYMTGLTISTIGYHEVINLDAHPYGRVFTIFLAFAGFGVLTYFASNLLALLIEGDLRKTFLYKNMIKRMEKLENHYIICGCGRVGGNIAIELYRTKRPFVVADTNEENLEEFAPEIGNTPFLAGDCTEDDTLELLGISRAQGIFIVSGDDNANLAMCLTARHLNPTIKIVARSKEIYHVRKLKQAGANHVVTPNYIGAQRMASEMLRPEITGFMDDMTRSEFAHRLEEILVPASVDDKTIADLPIGDLNQSLILAVRKGEQWNYSPKGDFKINEDDLMVLMTTPEERQILKERFI